MSEPKRCRDENCRKWHDEKDRHKTDLPLPLLKVKDKKEVPVKPKATKEMKSTRNYDNILLDTPFRILGKNDSTVWRKVRAHIVGNTNLQIYFHDLERWLNPPSDTHMEWQAQKNIDKHGIEYLAEGEEL